MHTFTKVYKLFSLNTNDREKILFITQWQYEDALIQTYTLPYIKIIKKITNCTCFLVCVDKSIDRIRIIKKESIVLICLPFDKKNQFMAWGKNLIALRTIIKNKSIRQLHAWCTPAGSFGLALKILSKNVNITIDSFEPHAEAMVENGEWSTNGIKNRFLFFMEKLEAKMANNLILAAPGMIKYIREKYKVEREKYYVKPACVDLDKFSANAVKDKDLLARFNLKDKIVGVYAGKFGGMYLEDETFGFIKSCQNYWGIDKFRFIILSSVSEEYIGKKSIEFSISNGVIIKLFVPYSKVEKYIGLADFGICPIKPVPSKKFCTPIKNGEYWALGLPIVIPPNISIDSDIIMQHNAGAILQSFDDKGYLSAIKQIDVILTSKARMDIYDRIRPLAEKYRSFNIAEKVYTAIYPS